MNDIRCISHEKLYETKRIASSACTTQSCILVMDGTILYSAVFCLFWSLNIKAFQKHNILFSPLFLVILVLCETSAFFPISE